MIVCLFILNVASFDASASSSSSMRRTTSCPEQKSGRKSDPVKEICDIDIKIADLGNACWMVSLLM